MLDALFLLIGIIIGWAGCLYAPRRKSKKAKEDLYASYKNEKGLYSRKAVKG